jgi:polyhydroxyalkanoate synthase
MADDKSTQGEFRLADPAQFARNMAKVFEHAAQIASRFADRPDIANREAESQVTPIDQVAKTLAAVAQAYAADPQKLMEAQMQLWAGYTQLWQSAWKRFLGEDVAPLATPDRNDRRFNDKDWKEHTVFDFLKQFLSDLGPLGSRSRQERRRHRRAHPS